MIVLAVLGLGSLALGIGVMRNTMTSTLLGGIAFIASLLIACGIGLANLLAAIQ